MPPCFARPLPFLHNCIVTILKHQYQLVNERFMRIVPSRDDGALSHGGKAVPVLWAAFGHIAGTARYAPLQVSTDAQAACASWPQHGKTADSQPHPLHHVHGRHRMAEWRRMGGKVPDVKGQGRSAAASPSWHMCTALNHEVPCTGPRMACAGSMMAAKEQQTCPENMSRSACRSFASELLLKGSGSMISCHSIRGWSAGEPHGLPEQPASSNRHRSALGMAPRLSRQHAARHPFGHVSPASLLAGQALHSRWTGRPTRPSPCRAMAAQIVMT